MFSGAFLVGVVAEARGDLLRRATKRLEVTLGPGEAVVGDFSPAIEGSVETALHTLHLQRLQLLPTREPFAIAEFHGRLLFATHSGYLGMVSQLSGPSSSISIFDQRVPMSSDALRSDPLWSSPLFVRSWFRTQDLYVESVSDTEGLLYVSHHAFVDGCFVLAVSRTTLRVVADELQLGRDWEEIFRSRPCLGTKNTGDLFAGIQSGGRMVSPAPGVLLLATGDHQFDGVHTSAVAPMDPEFDYGKVIEIDTRSLEKTVFATGMRNPQGLAVAMDGTIWQTEHGPQGGDELNLLRRGQNYGWPNVTYGMLYGSPAKGWPLSSDQGRHEGFARPEFAFVPSIGISNLVEADAKEFPRWEGDLLVGSLNEQTLFRLRREDDRVIYVEPILFPEPFRDRLRDVVSLSDGRLAFATDGGGLLLVGNDAMGEAAKRDLPGVAGYDSVRHLVEEDGIEDVHTSTLEVGRMVFEQSCASCHSLSGQSNVGPGLAGVVGRRIGGLADFDYSPRLRDDGSVWTRESLVSFLSDPDQEFRGTAMPRIFLLNRHYPAVVEFLEQVR